MRFISRRVEHPDTFNAVKHLPPSALLLSSSLYWDRAGSQRENPIERSSWVRLWLIEWVSEGVSLGVLLIWPGWLSLRETWVTCPRHLRRWLSGRPTGVHQNGTGKRDVLKIALPTPPGTQASSLIPWAVHLPQAGPISFPACTAVAMDYITLSLSESTRPGKLKLSATSLLASILMLQEVAMTMHMEMLPTLSWTKNRMEEKDDLWPCMSHIRLPSCKKHSGPFSGNDRPKNGNF